ncbi:MAG: LysR family transcriptional regulator [Alphaproteobacteria bacterium]|nr:LysR family transcriptional regulator [Alphaproteobacteria bacterium]
MDLKRLRYFLAVAENGSISRASEQIGITQQGLSRSIQLLEEELGVALIDRGRNGARLTVDGREFVGLAQSLISRFDSEIDSFLNKKSTPKMLRIGLSPAWLPGPGFSPIKLALDRVGVQQASISVKNHHDLLSDLSSNEIDVAATIRFFGDRDQPNFQRIGSMSYFVVGHDRDSVNKIAEDVKSLADHPLIFGQRAPRFEQEIADRCIESTGRVPVARFRLSERSIAKEILQSFDTALFFLSDSLEHAEGYWGLPCQTVRWLPEVIDYGIVPGSGQGHGYDLKSLAEYIGRFCIAAQGPKQTAGAV